MKSQHRALRVVFSVYVAAMVILLLGFSGVIAACPSAPISQGTQRNVQQIHRIDQGVREFTFSVSSDSRGSPRVFGELLTRIAAGRDLFGLHLGDVVMRADRDEYSGFIARVNSIGTPFMTAVGNHDSGTVGKDCYLNMLGPFYYAFTVGESRFIVLDDSEPAGLDDAQMTWLQGELAASAAYANRFVFMHKPLFDPREGESHCIENVQQARQLSSLFDQNRVTMAFAGHVHGYYEGVWGNTPYVITGGAGQQLVGSEPEHHFFHYVDVSVSQAGVKHSVVKLNAKPSRFIDVFLKGAWTRTAGFLRTNFFLFILPLCLLYLALFVIVMFRSYRSEP